MNIEKFKFLLPILFFALLLNGSMFSTVSADDSADLTCAGYSVNLRFNSPALMASNNLSLTEPQVIAMDTDNSCAVVAWNTDKLSTSQVIYAEESKSAELDLLDSDETTFWGYPQGSAQNGDAQVYHIMIINNLKKDEHYKLRAVSRSHVNALPFTSKEISFVFEKARLPQSNFNPNADQENKTTQAAQSGNTSSAQTPTANNTTNNNHNYYSPQYQNSLANQINRHYAPAQSNGKFVNTETEPTKVEAKKSEEQEKLSDTSTQEASTTASSTKQNNELVEVIGAANASESLNPLWDRIKNFFKNLFGYGDQDENIKDNNESQDEDTPTDNEDTAQMNTEDSTSTLAVNIHPVAGGTLKPAKADDSSNTATSVVADGMNTLASSSVAAASTASSWLSKLGFLLVLVPVLLILLVLYYLQKYLAKSYDWVSDKSINFWMAAFIALAVLFMLLSNVAMALVFLALFLIALAWHLFNIAVSDIEASAGSKIEEVKDANGADSGQK